jgi:protein-L-isoaspartate(D-aspartate) O-methyltransferase
MEDPFKEDRRRMVDDQIRRRGIHDENVLRAFLTVPRHEFVPSHLRNEAYRDYPLPIGDGQTISQPYMVASMSQEATIVPGYRVLEIGTGSGYQAAILSEMGAKVYTVERIATLSATAEETLRSLGYAEIHLAVGDGTLGWAEEAPFDAIIVTAGAPRLPQPLLDQLDMNGKLVVPIDEGLSQVLFVFTRTPDGIQRRTGERCTFVPLIGEYGWAG